MKKTLKYIYLNSRSFYYFFKLSFYNKFNEILIFNFGITYEDLLNGFFFGSIVLLFVRLFFRLIFFYDPFWFFNLSLYVFSVLFQLKYDFMYYIRYVVIIFLRKFLGNNYFKAQRDKIEPEKISFYHKIFQFLFTFLIFFRLWSFKSPIKFFIFIFFINFLLIFNNFFLFSSFFSFIIIFSRLAIFATKFNSKAFFGLINYIEAINITEEFIVISWYNAKVISLLVSMNLSFSMSEIKKYEHDYLHNDFVFYEKYIELYPFFNIHYGKHSHNMLTMYKMREAHHLHFINNDYITGVEYLPIIIISKRNKILNFSTIASYLNICKKRSMAKLEFDSQAPQNHIVVINIFYNLILQV